MNTATAAPAPVSKGLATWLGILGALAQYAAAIGAFASGAHDDVAIGALSTATVTLVTTIAGRMYQAGKALENPQAGAAAPPLVMLTTATTEWAEGPPEPDVQDPEPPPGPDPAAFSADLDDPGPAGDDGPAMVRTHGDLLDADDRQAAGHG